MGETGVAGLDFFRPSVASEKNSSSSEDAMPCQCHSCGVNVHT
jgi:hypothetical protein